MGVVFFSLKFTLHKTIWFRSKIYIILPTQQLDYYYYYYYYYLRCVIIIIN